MASKNPAERALVARLGAHTKWARTTDRSVATAAARKGLLDRFEREVDPDGVLNPRDRAVLAESARKAFYTRLAFKSAQARRRAAETLADADPGLSQAS